MNTPTSLLARGDLAMKSGADMGGTTWRRSNFMQNLEPSATFCLVVILWGVGISFSSSRRRASVLVGWCGGYIRGGGRGFGTDGKGVD